ncbi:zinc finger, CCHC-type containing protein [Tanacetum coccineum]
MSKSFTSNGIIPSRLPIESTIASRSTHITTLVQTTNNHLIFRSFLEKDKLTRPNFLDWYRNLRIVLKAKKKLVYLEQPVPLIPTYVAPAKTVHVDVLATHTRWVHAQQEIACLMLTSKTPKLQKNLEYFNVNDTLKELKTLFSQQAEHELLETVKALYACKQEKEKSVSSYVLKMKSYLDQLERLGNLVSLNFGVSLILTSLSKDYEGFVQNYNMHNIGKIIVELHAMLKLHEKGLPKKAATAPAVLAIRGGKIHKNNPNKQPQALKSGALNMYVGNGNRAAIEAIGSFDLILPNGLCIVLDNCHYASLITRGVISVSRLNDNDFIHYFTDYGIPVSKDYIVYFNAIPCDGIYEIDMHGCVSNYSSMYDISNKRAKHNLDSTFLWHCHLGYIYKKRIERLQHDGLSKPTDSKSFHKCVSCVSGKMARKPFLHKMERAKDLLGGGVIPKKIMGYYFYYPHEHKIIVARYAELFENSLISQEASGSHEDLEIIQDEDAYPYENTNNHHDEVKHENVELQSEEHRLGGHGKPTNYKATLSDLESDKWLEAMTSTWMAFGGNTRDLGSFGEETDKTTTLHQILEEVMHTECGDGVVSFKRRRQDV